MLKKADYIDAIKKTFGESVDPLQLKRRIETEMRVNMSYQETLLYLQNFEASGEALTHLLTHLNEVHGVGVAFHRGEGLVEGFPRQRPTLKEIRGFPSRLVEEITINRERSK